MSDVQLRVDNLWKTFHPGLFEPAVEVLKGLSLEVEKGEIFGFLGPNGAGKTTTIKAITGLVVLDKGEISIDGHAHDSIQAKRMIGFMAENPYLYNHLAGREYLRFSAELLGVDGPEVEDRVEAVLRQVSMDTRAEKKMSVFSKGMLQRIALAQALLGDPRLLILDEPMSGLDPIGRRDVRDIILGQKESGVTVFFSSHIIPDVETICDRFVGPGPSEISWPARLNGTRSPSPVSTRRSSRRRWFLPRWAVTWRGCGSMPANGTR